jgi:predicted glycosyltransferase
MKALIDVVHPAHVHFYRHVRQQLEASGHQTLVVGRDKDVTLDLLRAFDVPHLTHGRAGHRTMVGQALELVRRDLFLARRARAFGADVLLTRNPAGAQAARLAGVTGVFDTDDGTAVGIHFAAAKPFAHVITTPDCLTEDHGRRHVTYPSYKALAYLHPRRFRPDHSVRDELGLGADEHLFVVRFVAHDASHDGAIEGLPSHTRRAVVDLLAEHGRVVITSEAPLPPELEQHRLPVAPHRIHHVIAAASLTVGDSQTIAAESACLGVPALRLSSFSGRVDYLTEMEQRYGLVRNFRPGQEDDLLAALRATVDDLDAVLAAAREGHRRLLEEKVDLTSWYVDFVERVGAGGR